MALCELSGSSYPILPGCPPPPGVQVTKLGLTADEAVGKELCWSIVDATKQCTTVEDFCAGPQCTFTTFDPENDCCPVYTHTEAWAM